MLNHPNKSEGASGLCAMQAQIWAANDYASDTDSVRSEITAPVPNDHVGRKGRGRKGKPQRAAFDGYQQGAAREARASLVASQLATMKDQCAAAQLRLINNCSALAPAITAFNSSSHAIVSSAPEVPTALAVPATAPVSATASGKSSKKSKLDLAGPCCHCNVVSSPQWRKGPKGKPVLCNACGIRFLRNRTLTKVVPKKRRAGSGIAGAAAGPAVGDTAAPQSKRLKIESAIGEEVPVDLMTDEVLATDDATVTEDGLEETLSTQCEQSAQRLSASCLALATGPDTAAVAAAAAAQAEAEVNRELQLLEERTAADKTPLAVNSSSSSVSYNHSLLCHVTAGSHQPLAAGSRHVLLGSNRRLNHSPVLSLALAMHQQQQLQQEKSAPHSPMNIAASCFAASTSPVSNTSAYNTNIKLDQSEYSAGSGSAPASPLMLGATSSEPQLPILGLSCGLDTEQSPQQLEAAGCAKTMLLSLLSSTGSTTPAGPPPPQADLLQLVQQVAGLLGGVGPAVEFVKAMHNSRVAAAAAAAAAAVQSWQ